MIVEYYRFVWILKALEKIPNNPKVPEGSPGPLPLPKLPQPENDRPKPRRRPSARLDAFGNIVHIEPIRVKQLGDTPLPGDEPKSASPRGGYCFTIHEIYFCTDFSTSFANIFSGI